MLKDIIKTAIAQNAYFNAWFYKTASKNKNNEMQKLYQEMESWDTIKDVSELKRFRKEVEAGRAYYTTDPNLSNTRIYGNWESIFGQFTSNEVIATPAVEHGLIFHNQIFTDIKFTARMTVGTFSSFRKSIIQQYLKRPVFCVGPYIHYAKPFYPCNQFDDMKRNLGKTLLVFPTHSTNTSEISVQEDLFCKKISEIAKDYNSVLVNTFWWNINDTLIQKLASEGYHICSAGYRDDNKFLSRLKTIINLSDFAVGDSVGSHIGYCVDQGCPFSIINVDTMVTLKTKEENSDLDFVSDILKSIKSAFLNAANIGPEQIEICNKYWGLNEIKTCKEILAMLEISHLLLDLTHGNVSKIHDGIECLKRNKDLSVETRKVLIDAL